MPRFGEKYCFEIPNDPSVCPFIRDHEQHLLSDLNRRLRDKCMECDLFRTDLRELRGSGSVAADMALALLDEALMQGVKLTQFRRSLEMHDEMIVILSHLSSTLKLALDRSEIIFKALVAFTAGSSFGFNRGLAMIAEDGTLKGFFALGPRDHDEAARVWAELSRQKKSIVDLLHYTPAVFDSEREKFAAVLDRFRISMHEEPFLRCIEQGGAVLQVGPDDPVAAPLRDFYGSVPFWIVPLFSHLGVPLGAVLLDNFLVPRPVTDEDRRALEIFAGEVSLALERALVLEQLHEKIQGLEEANQRIREAQDLIFRLRESAAASQMVLQMTHSIKNPVVAIGGLSRRLQRRLGDDASSGKYTQAIAREASRLEETVRNFVKFMDTKYASMREPINLNQVVEALHHEKREISRINRIKFRLHLAPDLPPVMGDSRQIYNCLENIVVNAFEAMPKGGELVVTSSHNGLNVLVEIRDTGPGIPEEALTNIFKPFFTTKPTGSGLGLYTSRDIVEGMGGNLSVTVLPGEGCRVAIEIPAIIGEVQWPPY